MSILEYPKNKYYEIRYGKQFNKLLKQTEKDKQRIEDINESIIPLTFKPTKDGRYIETNDTFIQCLKVGMLTGKYKDRQEYPSNLDPRIIDEILNIGTKKETSIELCQVLYPLPPEDENDALEKARRSIAISSAVQEQKDKLLGQHDRANDFAAEGVDDFHRKVFNGTTRLFHFVLLVAVQGVTTEEVDKTMNLIRSLLDSKRILHETPIRGQVETYKTMQLTPYVWGKVFKKSVTVDFCAKTSLLRNPNPLLADSGRFIGMNERTGNPIFFDSKSENSVCGHALIIGKSGSGKTTDLLKDDIRALLDDENVFHIVPKKDGITNHLRVCEAMKGQLIKIGRREDTPNMLQIFFDPSSMDTSQDGYQEAYLGHFTTLLESIGLLVGSGYSDQQKNWLYDALSKLYEDFHVVSENGEVINMDRWQDGEFWPDFEDLRAIWWDWLNDGKHKNVAGPIEALYNNTKMLTRRGPLGYLVNKNSLKLDNPFIMADISALSSVPNVQEAVTMLLMSIVYTKMLCAKDGKAKPTLLTLDEGADLVKNPTMKNSIEKFFTQGRSWGLKVKIVSQYLAGFPRDMLDMIKANTDYILLLSTMRSDNVGPLVKEFGLNPADTARLLDTRKGCGLMLIGENKLDYLNVLDDFEKEAIFGKGALNFEEEQEQTDVFKIDPAIEWLVKDCKILCKDWIENMREYPNGYEKATATNPITGKRTVVFYKRSLVKEDGHIKNQTQDHYFTVCLLAGELSRLGAYVTLDDYGTGQEADAVAVFTLADGTKKTIAFEYETPESKHSVKDLRDKRENLKTKEQGGRACFDEVIFIGKHEHVEFLIDALGSDFVLQRGAEVADYIQKIQTCKPDIIGLPLIDQNTEAA